MNRITLKLDDKDLGFHFGLGFMGKLLEDLDCSIDELMEGIQKNPFKFIPKLMHSAYSYNLQRESKDVEFNIHSFTDLLDENGGVMSEVVKDFLEAFTNSIIKDVPKAPNKIPSSGKRKASLTK